MSVSTHILKEWCLIVGLHLLLSVSDDDEVCFGDSVGKDGRSEHVVLKGRLALARGDGAKEGRGVGVGQLAILILGWVTVLAWFLK